MPFNTPVVDTFNTTESPISDSGQWFNRRYWGSNDFLQTQAVANWAIHWGEVPSDPEEPDGPGITVRMVNPGSMQDQEVYCRSNGLGGGVRLIVRCDTAGSNFYAGHYGAPGGVWQIEKWAHGAMAVVVSRATSAFHLTGDPTFWCGLRAIGSEIQMWSGNAGSSNPTWHLPGAVPAVTYTDTDFATGHIGMGCQGIFTVIENFVAGGGLAPPPPPGPPNVFTPPILLPYEKLVVPRIG